MAGTTRGTGGRTGRPPLSERRKAATRLEIASEAVRLFTAQGVAATSGEEIAAAAGVSARTLWRYFSAKEQCIRPLLTVGLDTMTELLRTWPRERPLREAVTQVAPTPIPPDALRALRDLVRLTRDEPGLRAVWLEVHFDAEARFAEILADRASDREQVDPLTFRVQAVMFNGALRVAVEDWAWRSPHTEADTDTGEAAPADPADPTGDGDAAVRRALRVAVSGLPL